MNILKEVKKSPFIGLRREIYIGPIKYGSPYNHPVNFCRWGFRIKQLAFTDNYSYRNYWGKVLSIGERKYLLEAGSPIDYVKMDIGWKDKMESPRFEYSPFKMIYFFLFQFAVFYVPKVDKDNYDLYWEMFLWWKYYANKNLKLAKETWPWVKNDGASTWNDDYIKPEFKYLVCNN